MFQGGDLLEINWKHPTLGGGSLQPKSGEDSNIDPGGYRSNDDANGVTGAGEMIDQINRVRWSAEVPIAWDMISIDEVKALANLAASSLLTDFTFTHINGTVWGAKGKPVGDIIGNANTAQLPIKFAGGGTLEKVG